MLIFLLDCLLSNKLLEIDQYAVFLAISILEMKMKRNLIGLFPYVLYIMRDAKVYACALNLQYTMLICLLDCGSVLFDHVPIDHNKSE